MESSRVIKIPTNIKIKNRPLLKAYAGYLLLKTFNPEGRILVKDISQKKGDKDFYSRLLKNLVSLGWATKNGGCFYLTAYQSVWRKMGIEKFMIKKIRQERFSYAKFYVEDIPKTRAKCIKRILKLIEKHVCERKLEQIKYGLSIAKSRKTGVNNSEKPVQYSAKSVAKLLGYKSRNSGHRARPKYFKMKKIKHELLKMLSSSGSVFYRSTCGQLDI